MTRYRRWKGSCRTCRSSCRQMRLSIKHAWKLCWRYIRCVFFTVNKVNMTHRSCTILFQAQGRVLQYLHLLFQHHDVAVMHAMSASSGTDLIGVISCSTSTLVAMSLLLASHMLAQSSVTVICNSLCVCLDVGDKCMGRRLPELCTSCQVQLQACKST